MRVEAWLPRAAAAAPSAVAIDTPRGACSYAELLAAAQSGAAQLAARGARDGTRVALALPPGLEFARALHACLLLGAVAVPVDLRLGARERATIEAGTALVVDESLPAVSVASADAPMPSAGVPLPAAPALPLPASSRVAPGASSVTAPALHDLDAPAAVIHTSGTTAAPRPVELTYGNLLWSALGSAVALGLDPRERWLCALPLSHVGGLSILVRSAIYATTAIVHERFQTDAVLYALNEQQITLVSLVATTLARLLDAGLSHPPTLRYALTGGGPVPPALLDRARAAGVPIALTYGLTETCSQATTAGLTSATARGAASDTDSDTYASGASVPSAGAPLFCTRVRIADASPQRPGELSVGEILVAGPTVAPGSVGPDGWLRTGDLGRLSERGDLHVTGRKADTIVSGGENVAPTEVEAVLGEHPDVLEAAVIGRPDPQWGEAVAAIVVARAGSAPHGEALRAHCASRLAPYKVPKQVALVAGPLPRTRSGKLLRRELRWSEGREDRGGMRG